MDIAVTSPTTWPYVRRGAERFINELAAFLGRRNHRVTIISAKPGGGEIVQNEGYSTVLHRRLWHPAEARIGLLEFHAFFPVALGALLRHKYDAVLSTTFMDAYAAILAGKLTGTPSIFWVNGLRTPIRYVRSLTTGGAVFGRAIRQSDEVIALSSYMQVELQKQFGRWTTRVPVPVDTHRFVPGDKDHSRPIILCAAALEDHRKGGRLLMAAFDRLKQTRRELILQISCNLSPERREELQSLVSAEWRGDVQFLGAGQLSDLPTLFARASVSVLPSRWEPFGMVILESMAAGTPVVGARDGAIPELINRPSIGTLFDPGPEESVEPTNLDGLIRALEDCLELSCRPETVENCRQRAEEFRWEAVGPEFEQLFEKVIAERRK